MKTLPYSLLCGVVAGVLAAGAWAQTQTVATRALLAAPVNFATGDEPSAVATGDFNRDGKLDFFVANRAGNSITVFRGNGSGGFAADAPIAVPAGPEALAVADYNGDARLDLVVTNAGSANVTLLAQNSGGGGWQSPVTFAIGAGTTPRSPVLADLDADGRLDLIVANGATNGATVLLHTGGTGSFTFGVRERFASSVWLFTILRNERRNSLRKTSATWAVPDACSDGQVHGLALRQATA